MKYDIIGDIHGYGEELEALLRKLGYKQDENGAYKPGEPDRQAIFLGDFIDRGPEQFGVLRLVKGMVDAGSAQAIMGNHEFNAGMYHTNNAAGMPMRPHNEKNNRQHQVFLTAMEHAPDEAREHIEWCKNLPVYLELEGINVIHALWDDEAIRLLKEHGVLDDENRIRPDQWEVLENYHAPLGKAAERILKGVEISLPAGVTYVDHEGIERDKARLKWWVDPDDTSLTLDKVLLDVPAGKVPAVPLPDHVQETIRNAQPSEKTVFFGHYWQTGELPAVESPRAICLDQSVAKQGHLAAATVIVDKGKITDIEFTSVPHRSRGKATGAGQQRWEGRA